jgi:hypothetical protein
VLSSGQRVLSGLSRGRPGRADKQVGEAEKLQRKSDPQANPSSTLRTWGALALLPVKGVIQWNCKDGRETCWAFPLVLLKLHISK